MKPRKHAELIKNWADGAESQVWNRDALAWQYQACPAFIDDYEYREKPKPEPKPDVVHELSIMLKGNNKFGYGHPDYPSLRITFDGETGELKSAEVI